MFICPNCLGIWHTSLGLPLDLFSQKDWLYRFEEDLRETFELNNDDAAV